MPRNPYKVISAPTGYDNTNDTMSTPDNTAQALVNFLCDRAGLIRAQVQLTQVADLSSVSLIPGVPIRAYGMAYYYGSQSISGFDGQGNAITISFPNPSADRLIVQIQGTLYACAYTGIGVDPTVLFFPTYPPAFNAPVIIPGGQQMAGTPFPRIRSAQFTKELIIVQNDAQRIANIRYYVAVNSIGATPDPGVLYPLGIRTPAAMTLAGNPGANYHTPGGGNVAKIGQISYTYTLSDEFHRQSSPPIALTLDFNANPTKDALLSVTINNTGITPQPYYFIDFYATVQGGSLFFNIFSSALTSGNNVITYEDGKTDAVVETGTVGPQYGQNDPPNPASLVVNFKNRLWLNDVANPNTVQASNLNSPTQFNSQGYPALNQVSAGVTLAVDQDYGNPLTGMAVFGSFLLLAKQKGLFLLYGNDASNFQIQPVQSARGVVAPDTFIRCENVMFYLSEDGVYQFDGINCVKMSKQIEASILQYNLTDQGRKYYVLAQAAFVARRYILNIGLDIYVYDFDAQGWTAWLFGVYIIDYILASYGWDMVNGPASWGNNPYDPGVPGSAPTNPNATGFPVNGPVTIPVGPVPAPVPSSAPPN